MPFFPFFISNSYCVQTLAFFVALFFDGEEGDYVIRKTTPPGLIINDTHPTQKSGLYIYIQPTLCVYSIYEDMGDTTTHWNG